MGNQVEGSLVSRTLTTKIMTEEQQSLETVPGSQELSAPEGVQNAEVQATPPTASQPATQAQGDGVTPPELAVINRATGRNYKSLDEAEKGLKETSSYLGTLGPRASLVEKLAKKVAKENNISEEAALRYISDLATQEQIQQQAEQREAPQSVAPASTVRSPQDYQQQMLQERLNELELLRKFPDAEAHIDLIKRVARADNRDYRDIYEKDVKPLLVAKESGAHQASKAAASVASSSHEAPAPDEYARVFKNFQDGKASLMDVLRAKGMRIEGK